MPVGMAGTARLTLAVSLRTSGCSSPRYTGSGFDGSSAFVRNVNLDMAPGFSCGGGEQGGSGGLGRWWLEREKEDEKEREKRGREEKKEKKREKERFLSLPLFLA